MFLQTQLLQCCFYTCARIGLASLGEYQGGQAFDDIAVGIQRKIMFALVLFVGEPEGEFAALDKVLWSAYAGFVGNVFAPVDDDFVLLLPTLGSR